MKLKAEIDLEQFYDEFGDTINKFIADELKRDILKQIKSSKEYKTLVEKTLKKHMESFKI